MLRNPSRCVNDLGRLHHHSTSKHSNPIQSLRGFGEGSVKDFSESKALINRYISLFSINPSRLHAHPCARPAYVCARGWEGCVKDFSDGLGTPGQKSSGEAIGNGRKANHSLFYLSEMNLAVQPQVNIQMDTVNSHFVCDGLCTFLKSTTVVFAQIFDSRPSGQGTFGTAFFDSVSCKRIQRQFQATFNLIQFVLFSEKCVVHRTTQVNVQYLPCNSPVLFTPRHLPFDRLCFDVQQIEEIGLLTLREALKIDSYKKLSQPVNESWATLSSNCRRTNTCMSDPVIYLVY